jgi:hypothetical protein
MKRGDAATRGLQTNSRNHEKRSESAGEGRAREHGVEPVVIGLVRRMVRGMYWMVQSAKAGFGRLSNESVFVRISICFDFSSFMCGGCCQPLDLIVVVRNFMS